MMNNPSNTKGATCSLPILSYTTIFDCLDHLETSQELSDSLLERLLELTNTIGQGELPNAIDALSAAYALLDDAVNCLTHHERLLSFDENTKQLADDTIKHLKQQLAKEQAKPDCKDSTVDWLQTELKNAQKARDNLNENPMHSMNQRRALRDLESQLGKNRFRVESWINTVADSNNLQFDVVAALPYPDFIQMYNRIVMKNNLEAARNKDEEAQRARQAAMQKR
ncbi:hypothetical protein BZJ19_11635 [Salinivibrio proteolyticus]|uniref:hypothetical protein n=1 Tax=Salinivibrio proteolyticus TaxID=334715 RepID=UPI000988ACFC|nr:hypothetical protein [Salinivibrio proteolyticus]OOF24023.1 hypothetical protein BZJ19_11635 [Salinivibrio proteolyticus]